MSKTSASAKTKASKSTAPKKRNEVGAAMLGRDIFVEALEREGVEVIFAYPGGASMEIHQSLTTSKILSPRAKAYAHVRVRLDRGGDAPP